MSYQEVNDVPTAQKVWRNLLLLVTQVVKETLEDLTTSYFANAPHSQFNDETWGYSWIAPFWFETGDNFMNVPRGHLSHMLSLQCHVCKWIILGGVQRLGALTNTLQASPKTGSSPPRLSAFCLCANEWHFEVVRHWRHSHGWGAYVNASSPILVICYFSEILCENKWHWEMFRDFGVHIDLGVFTDIGTYMNSPSLTWDWAAFTRTGDIQKCLESYLATCYFYRILCANEWHWEVLRDWGNSQSMEGIHEYPSLILAICHFSKAMYTNRWHWEVYRDWECSQRTDAPSLT